MTADYDALLCEDMRRFVADCESFYGDVAPDANMQVVRAAYDAMAASMRVARPTGLMVVDDAVGEVPVRVYGAGDTTVFYIHGGGFAMGDLESHDDVCAEIADGCAVRVVALGYRLAPENPHPAQLEDCVAVLEWLRSRYGPRVILAGDSAGGTLAAVLGHRYGAQEVLGQVLIYPSLGGDPTRGSYITHAQAPLLTTGDMALFKGILGAPGGAMEPLKWADLSKMPPTFAQGAACDPLADDAEAFVARLQGLGIAASRDAGEGLVHSFLRARHRAEPARRAFGNILGAIRGFAGS